MNPLKAVEADTARPALAPVWPNPACQPLAVLSLLTGEYRPACLCGWQARATYKNRAEALVMAGALHDRAAS